MKKWGFLIVFGGCLVAVAWLSVRHKSNVDYNTLVYIDYLNNSDIVSSETTYIPDSSNRHFFQICQSRNGNNPCKKVYGIQHGAQKWYSNSILQYEDFYDKGKLTHTINYYKNGLKKKEYLYQDDKLSQLNLYSKNNGNPLIETIFYKDNEEIKKYYVNNKIQKEEKYRNKKLVSRKIYDSDGLLLRLEEYNFIGNNEDFDTFEGLDSVNPFSLEQDMPDFFDRPYRYYIPQNDTQDNILTI